MFNLISKTILILLLFAFLASGCSKIHRIDMKGAIRLRIIETEAVYQIGLGKKPITLNLELTNISDEDVVVSLHAGSFLLRTVANPVSSFEEDVFASNDGPGCPEDCSFWLPPGESEVLEVVFVRVPDIVLLNGHYYEELCAVYQVSARRGDVEREYFARSRDILMLEVKPRPPEMPVPIRKTGE